MRINSARKAARPRNIDVTRASRVLLSSASSGARASSRATPERVGLLFNRQIQSPLLSDVLGAINFEVQDTLGGCGACADIPVHLGYGFGGKTPDGVRKDHRQ